MALKFWQGIMKYTKIPEKVVQPYIFLKGNVKLDMRQTTSLQLIGRMTWGFPLHEKTKNTDNTTVAMKV